MLSFHGQTTLYGIFGYPIGHSLSPLMHNTAFAHHGIEAVYLPFAVHPAYIRRAVKSIAALQMGGVNVTIPHKQAVLAWMDELSPEARLIGAVNTIHLQDGRLHGYNTDGIGFLAALNEAGSVVAGQTVMLLGAGGAARAIAVQLCLAGIRRLYWPIAPQHVPRTLPPSLSKISPMPISVSSPWGNHPWQPCCQTQISWSMLPPLGCVPTIPCSSHPLL